MDVAATTPWRHHHIGAVMCGFTIIVTAPGQTVSGALLRRLTDSLTHRGPDGVGYACVEPTTGVCRSWHDVLPADEPLSGVLFGHRRLSIVDRSAAGHQPMFSDDRSRVLCFNGEIYNFVELRDELRAMGVAFRGRSDTEVLLRAYEQWGEDALARLNGMWVFALWDGRSRKLVISRDRFGIKPLYYTVVDGAWVFASEIKTLLHFPGAFRGFSDRNVVDFLAHCLVDHGETTLFQGIRQVPPASIAVLADGTPTLRRFWSIQPDESVARRPEAEAVAQFRELLTDAVRLRLRSDVPVGTIMSGGIDSTAVTAIGLRQWSRGPTRTGPASAGPDFAALSACWPGWEHDEEPEVDLVCTALGVTSHKVYPTGETIGELLPRVAYFLEEPFANPTAAVQYLLMREAHERGMKVILNGQGSDEVLGGYPDQCVPAFLTDLLLSGRPIQYVRERRAFADRTVPSDRVLAEHAVSALMPRSVQWRLARRRADERLRGLGIFPEAGRTATERHDAEVSSGGASALGSRFAQTPPTGLSRLNRLLWYKVTQGLLPMWLRMEDRMSMACSVETRAPFLDHRLVEFAFGLPDEMKLRNGYTKHVLRQAMRETLPAPIVLSRLKRRFATPYLDWMRGPWRPIIEDLFAAPCKVESYVDLPTLRRKARAYMAGDRDALDGRVLWRVVTTEAFLRVFAEPTHLPPAPVRSPAAAVTSWAAPTPGAALLT